MSACPHDTPRPRRAWRRRAAASALLVGSVALVISLTGTATASASKRPSPVVRPVLSPTRPAKPHHGTPKKGFRQASGGVVGVYAGPGAPAAVAAISNLVGHKVRYAMDFLDGSSWSTIDDPSWLTSVWNSSGYKMIWGVPMLPNSGASLATGATGAYNQYFKTLAERLVAQDQGSSIIRIGWEFNGGWFPWAANGHAKAFVAYWRQIVDSMRSVKGQHFSFEWNPTRGDMWVGPLSQYYPGNKYVTYVGLDVYDIEWQTYPGRKAEWTHMLTQSYGLDWLVSFGKAHHKQLCIPEWGLGWNTGGMASGGDNGYFVGHMSSWIATHHVANAVAFDYGSNPLPSAREPAAKTAFATSFSG
jgi:hypothetical protein